VCIFCWKTEDLLCLNRINAALDEWHSETWIRRIVEMKNCPHCNSSLRGSNVSACHACGRSITDEMHDEYQGGQIVKYAIIAVVIGLFYFFGN
jgi:hypothetical protein